MLDLDGVVWRGREAIPGSAGAIQRLRAEGIDVVYCTNHAQSPSVKRRELAARGMPGFPVVTSAEAAAAQCAAGDRVLVLGDRSLVEVFTDAGLEAVDTAALPADGPAPSVEVVVVGAAADWDRSRVGLAADAVRAGARFLATNDDATYPVTGAAGPRLLPGNGALVAAVEVTSGRTAEVTGKPHAAMADLLRHRYGPVDVVVGDKPETDGGLARTLGARFALVLTGVTGAEHLPVVPEPAVVGADLADVVAQLVTSDPGRAT
ncbi:MAG: HAD-IIA family hydrolase [Microthrixaceae bacterium]